jgi:hypothetical protein
MGTQHGGVAVSGNETFARHLLIPSHRHAYFILHQLAILRLVLPPCQCVMPGTATAPGGPAPPMGPAHAPRGVRGAGLARQRRRSRAAAGGRRPIRRQRAARPGAAGDPTPPRAAAAPAGPEPGGPRGADGAVHVGGQRQGGRGRGAAAGGPRQG